MTVPLYARIREDLRGRLDAGEWRPGEYLPPEPKLSEHYRVSRTTVRSAIAGLVLEGRLFIDRGNGTRVMTPTAGDEVHLGISRMIRDRGMTPSVRAESATTRQVTGKLAEFLGSADVVEIRRIHLADAIPISMSTSWVARRTLGGIDRVGESLYAILDDLGTPVLTAVDSFAISTLDADQAAALKAPEGDSVLSITRRGLGSGGVGIEYTHTLAYTARFEPTIVTRNHHVR